MQKPFSKYVSGAFALTLSLGLILPLAPLPADASASSPTASRSSSSSFKSGFSSQRSSSSSSSASKSSGGFGSFGSRRADSKAANDGGAKGSGGFGSFRRAPSQETRRSDSALSRKLDKENAEANALRTLDERRAAQAAREARDSRATRPVPGYEDRNAGRDARTPPNGYGNGYGYPQQPQQPPVVVNNGGGSGIGLGHVIAGAVIAKSISNAHANNNGGNSANNNNAGGYYPAPSGGGGDLANQAGANDVGTAGLGAGSRAAPVARKSGSFFGTFMTLCVLVAIGWGIWYLLKRRKAKRAADKPNYSFERN